MKRLLNCNVQYINDLWNPNTGFQWAEAAKKGLLKTDWLTWLGLVRAIPTQWLKTLKNNMQCELGEFTLTTRQVRPSNTPVNLDKIKTNQVYQQLISKKFENPTSQRTWQSFLTINCEDWGNCTNCTIPQFIRPRTIDTKLRWFQ